MKRLKNEVELKAMADKIPGDKAFLSVPEAGIFLALPKESFSVSSGRVKFLHSIWEPAL